MNAGWSHHLKRVVVVLVGRGAGLATVRQAVSAIGAAHRAAGVDSPTESEVVRLTIAGLSRQNRRTPVQALALLDDAVEAILATARSPRERDRRGMESPGRAARRGVVDIALVLRDCGLRRSEAVAFVWSDIEQWDDGSGRLLIERSKTDLSGEGEVVFITRRAMTALDELRQLRGDTSPSVFGMTANTINRRVKAAALRASMGSVLAGCLGSTMSKPCRMLKSTSLRGCVTIVETCIGAAWCGLRVACNFGVWIEDRIPLI